MEIRFCDICHTRVTDAEVRRGRGICRGELTVCDGCVEKGLGTELLQEAVAELDETARIAKASTKMIPAVSSEPVGDDVDDLPEATLPDEMTPSRAVPVLSGEGGTLRPSDPAAAYSVAASGFCALAAVPVGGGRVYEEDYDEDDDGLQHGRRSSVCDDDLTDEYDGEDADDDWEDIDDFDEGDDVARPRSGRNSARSGSSGNSGSSGRRDDRGGSGRRNGDSSRMRAAPAGRGGNSRSDRSAQGGRSDRGSGRSSARGPARGRKKNNNALIIGISAISVVLIIIIGLVVAGNSKKAAVDQPVVVAGISNPALEGKIKRAVQQAASAVSSQNLSEVQTALDTIKAIQLELYAFQDAQGGGSNAALVAWSRKSGVDQMQSMIRSLNDEKSKLTSRR